MGFSGVGKSAFISQCRNLDTQNTPPVVIGHGQESCTLQVQVYRFFFSQTQTIYLIDTPGFENTELSDTQVLAIITQWLANAYNTGVPLMVSSTSTPSLTGASVARPAAIATCSAPSAAPPPCLGLI
jgi:predicted GTPase